MPEADKHVLVIYEPHEAARRVVGTVVPAEVENEFEGVACHTIWNTELPSDPMPLFQQYDAIALWNVRMPHPDGYDIVDILSKSRKGRRIPLICGSYAPGEPHALLEHARKRGIKTVWKFTSGMISSLVGGIVFSLQRSNIGRSNPAPGESYQIILPSEFAFPDHALRSLAARPDMLYTLSPHQFELLIAELLERDGWSVELTGRSADGGIDIFALNRLGTITHRMLVQAKRYSSHRKVGVSVVREVLYLVDRHRANSGLSPRPHISLKSPTESGSCTIGDSAFATERQFSIGSTPTLLESRPADILARVSSEVQSCFGPGLVVTALAVRTTGEVVVTPTDRVTG